jgi:hypothetical protein
MGFPLLLALALFPFFAPHLFESKKTPQPKP